MSAVEISNDTLVQIVNLLQKQIRQVAVCSTVENTTVVGPLIKRPDHDTQVQAVIYIIVVLMFYSITLGTLLIKYMKQEERTAQEEQVYHDFLTRTKQLALQQAKADFARRVSLQLVNMANFGQMRYPDKLGRLSTLMEVSEYEASVRSSNNGTITKKENDKRDIREIMPLLNTLRQTDANLSDEATTEESVLIDNSDNSEKIVESRVSVV